MPRETEPLSPDTPPKRGVSPWIKLFVFVHLAAVTSWSLPTAPEALTSGRDRLGVDRSSPLAAVRSIGRDISDGTLLCNDRYVKTSPLKFYLLFTGFWQYWDMFSPNPASVDFYGTALITYKDGSTRLYTYPRMYDLGIPKKYVSERYRKFYERAHLEDYSWVWPTFAQRVALKNCTDPNNPPVKVILTRHWLPIAPPGKPQQHDYNTYNYFEYKVDQQQLQKDFAGGIFG